VIGEGAGVLVLETLAHGRKRQAEPLAVIKGFGMTSDGYNVALPDPNGKWAAAAIEGALKDAELNRVKGSPFNACMMTLGQESRPDHFSFHFI